MKNTPNKPVKKGMNMAPELLERCHEEARQAGINFAHDLHAAHADEATVNKAFLLGREHVRITCVNKGIAPDVTETILETFTASLNARRHELAK